MARHMQRGLNQVLFKFPPGATFTNTKHNAIEVVKEITGDDLDLRSEEEIIRGVHARLDAWEGGVASLLPPSTRNYAVVKPNEVYAKVFPRVFYCKSCGHAHNYSGSRIRGLESGGLDCQRAGCDGTLSQIHHVMLCPNCSGQESVSVPGCNDHDWEHIYLDDSSDRYRHFRWMCGVCGKTVKKGLHQTCSCGTKLIPSVHSASKTHRIHDFTRVDLSGRDVYNTVTVGDDDIDAILLGAYFDMFDHPSETIADIASQSGSTGDIDPDELDEGDLEVLKRLDLFGDGSDRERVISDVKALVEEPAPSPNLRRFIMLQEALELSHVTEEHAGGGRTADILDRMGIEEISLTSEFPLMKAVFGYHRTFEDQDGEGSIPAVRTFSMINVDGESKVPIYATKTETEAAIVRLDPRKVGHWLHENGHDIPDTLGMDLGEARAAIYTRMQPVEPYTSIGNDDEDGRENNGDGENGDRKEEGDTNYNPLTTAVHRLLHTISHLLLQRAAVYSGIEETSFAEYMFPEGLATAIYSNNTHSYTAGGLFTLVDRNLSNWLSGTLEASEQCFYDSTCATVWDGACHACVHTSEVGCQYFNKNLSRIDLYGDRIANKDRTGYWTIPG